MANRIATILGVGFLLVGVLGFFAPGVAGMHLSMVHNVVHLATGAVSLWIGLKGSPAAARGFCLAFGAVYLLLGVAGFVAGSPAGTPLPGPGDDRMLKLIPGMLELGTRDHIVHIVLGALYLIGGVATRTVASAPPPARAA